jgi:hypothetical protein
MNDNVNITAENRRSEITKCSTTYIRQTETEGVEQKILKGMVVIQNRH